ncbi:hypothetical protein [uncultured Bacteroides sp.]|jgi:hypothetical protein|uniref:hypothetical protein n=1 Tax=uncultured Bacteroides sp. TaxID=162156 RepID=UPI0025F8CDA2|nr:hypothetical protein [uncultured Bacteroides sp.]
MTDFNIELLAAKVLADNGISLPLRLPGGRHMRWVMRVPNMESRVRISKMYLRMGVKYTDLEKYTFEQKLDFMRKHTKTVSRMVAYGIVRGWLLGRLLNRPVAWMLRNCMHPAALEEAWMLAIGTMNTVPFGNIIRLAQVMNLMSPNLSHGKR